MLKYTLLLSAALAIATVGCKKEADSELAERCAKAVDNVILYDQMTAPDATGKPSKEEKSVIDEARKKARATCESEGLTAEQAACFDSVKDIQTMFEAADCPAIAAKKPSWYRVPPPDQRRKALESIKARKAKTGN